MRGAEHDNQGTSQPRPENVHHLDHTHTFPSAGSGTCLHVLEMVPDARLSYDFDIIPPAYLLGN